jgi:hypothetical protein
MKPRTGLTARRAVALLAVVAVLTALSQVQVSVPLLLVALLTLWAVSVSGALLALVLRGGHGVQIAVLVRRGEAP